MTKPPPPPTRVLLLLHDLSLTGAPKAALDAAEALRPFIDIRILAQKGGPLADRCRALGPTRVLKGLPPRRFPQTRRLRGQIGAVLRLEAVRWKPDLIYANSVAVLPLVRDLSLDFAPGLLHVHEMESVIDHQARLHPDCIEPLLRAWPKRIVAVSEAVRDNLIARHAAAVAAVAVVPASIRDADFRAPLSVGRRDDRFVVGGAGSVEWRKGDTQWLQMAAELTRILGKQNVRFVWVGVRDNDEGRRFRATADLLKIADSIDFVSPTREPFPHFASFDVFAMTSWEDPCPAVVLEAMMLEKPVVCFAGSGGAPEEIGDTGAIVPDFSPLRMAEAIAALAADPAERERKGKLARERVRTHFLASIQMPRLLNEIRRAAGTPD